jgi:hypothetical protein
VEEREIQEIVNELLKKKSTERARKFRSIVFALFGIACLLFGAWTENRDNEIPLWVYDLGLHDGGLFLVGFGLLLVSAYNSK